jgi:hypothetical protein
VNHPAPTFPGTSAEIAVKLPDNDTPSAIASVAASAGLHMAKADEVEVDAACEQDEPR